MSNNLTILSFNLYKGEKESQIQFINETNHDLLFLSECSENICEKLNNYHGSIFKSHCKYTYLGIKKSLNLTITPILTTTGIIISHIKNDNFDLVVGSLHLHPFKDDRAKRKAQLTIIKHELKTRNLTLLPIIIGGDTNMQDDETSVIQQLFLNDTYIDFYNLNYQHTSKNKNFNTNNPKLYQTFPNKNNPNLDEFYSNITNKRYNRCFYKRCVCNSYKVIPNVDSDHLAITVGFTI